MLWRHKFDDAINTMTLSFLIIAFLLISLSPREPEKYINQIRSSMPSKTTSAK